MSERVETHANERVSDHAVEQVVGRLLQIGVLVAVVVVVIGAFALLSRHGATVADFRTFRPDPESLRTLHGIVRGARAFDARAVVQLGIVLLIATPVARVALTLVAFVLQRDRLYVAVTAVVLAVLLYGLLYGKA